jgi:tetratricopeptide (TPR) repeat protein
MSSGQANAVAYLSQNPGIVIVILGCVLILVGLLARANVKGVDITIDAGKSLRTGAFIVGVLLCTAGLIVQFTVGDVSSRPHDPKGLYEDAKNKRERGQTRGIVEELQNAADGLGDPHKVDIQRYPWAPALYAELGSALFENGKSDAAKEMFYDTLYLDPDTKAASDGLRRLGNNSNEKLADYYLEFGNELASDPARAATFFRKYIDIKPGDPEGYYKVGTTFNVLQKWAQADANFKEAEKRITPGYELTQAYLDKDWGFTLLQERKYVDAIRKFEVAIGLFNKLGQDPTWAQKGLDMARQQKATGH